MCDNRENNREFFGRTCEKPHELRVFVIPMHENRELTGNFTVKKAAKTGGLCFETRNSKLQTGDFSRPALVPQLPSFLSSERY